VKDRGGHLVQGFSNFWSYGTHEEIDHNLRSPTINFVNAVIASLDSCKISQVSILMSKRIARGALGLPTEHFENLWCSQPTPFITFRKVLKNNSWKSNKHIEKKEGSYPCKMSFGSRPSSILHTWPLQRSRYILRRENISGAPVLSIIVVFGIRSRQETPRMDRRQRKWNALSLFSWYRYVGQVSQP